MLQHIAEFVIPGILLLALLGGLMRVYDWAADMIDAIRELAQTYREWRRLDKDNPT